MEPELEPVALTPQKQDNAWKHCEIYKYGDRLQMRCLYCRKMFKGGGITRVKEHLAGIKGQGVICDQVPEDVRLFLRQCIEGTVRRQRKRRHSTSAEPESLPLPALPPCEAEPMMMVVQSDVNNGFTSPESTDVVVQNEGRTKQRPYRRKKAAFLENGSSSNNNGLIGTDMDTNLVPVAISSVKNIVHPASKDRENAVHMAVGRFLFGIGADFDAAMVTSPEWNESVYLKEASGLAMTATIDDEAFWKAIAMVNDLVGPLLRVLKIACSEKRPGMGYVYAALYRAKEAIKRDLVNKEDYMVYWRTIDQWWEQQQHVQLYGAGFFLNPKFFYTASEEMRGEMVQFLVDCIERLVPDKDIQDKFSKELNSYKNALGVFGRNLAIRARDTMLPGTV
ncbi:hypothetical protein F2Q69_00034651 [Brassica cretica]|uniref:BED-type domain-containing protein n=1 Tax=Brassica cretica TaxID=69181 RepID=A0A8S9SPC0_BRACR|nr:hypothetical protein F2Q69_00034651 [Brassica cretica]